MPASMPDQNDQSSPDGGDVDLGDTMSDISSDGETDVPTPMKRIELPQHGQEGLPIIRPPVEYDDSSITPNNLEYHVLPTATSIRLLRIHPSAKNITENDLYRPTIECSVVVVDLDAQPSHDTLSYTRGDPCTLYLSESEISPESAWMARPFERAWASALHNG